MLWVFYCFLYLVVQTQTQSLPHSCESPIYCYGELLKTVQLARIYNDSKTFVDFKLIHPQNETLENFKVWQEQTGNNPTKDDVRRFVNENFEPGNELENTTLTDFDPNPKFLDEIKDLDVQNFTRQLILKWPTLARHIKTEVTQNSQLYSIIPVDNPFIIPGGRFREYYYWDSYWIIDGLLLNNMRETVKGMIDNFLSLVNRFGFVPNGGRVYYLRRSQPPLLTPMAYLYYQNTKNTEWLKKSIGTLEKELKYWSNQTVKVRQGLTQYTLLRYYAPSEGPRPESYGEDYATAGYFTDPQRKQQVYTDLKSGAESGWDFSARWIFNEQGGNNANLSFIQTSRVIPVDLNAFYCGALREISELYYNLGNLAKGVEYRIKYEDLKRAINQVLWNKEDKIWYDYDIKLNKHRRLFYPSSVTPLWSKCYDEWVGNALGQDVVDYLNKKGVLDYLGGIPTSDDNTGEQWDFPNAWPPLQDIVVRGLQNSKNKAAVTEAEILAKRWINSNMIGYNRTKAMFEKYDAVVPGQYGEGGEYEVQEGFGWSNGVALRFVKDYYTN